MPRSPLSVLGALALAAAVSAAPASATLGQPTQSPPIASDRDSAPASAPSVERLAGEHRYATAAEVAAQWPTGIERAYVVSGQNFPDAMVAAARAGVFDAPVLLTHTDNIPSDTATALQRLQPNQLVVVGAPGAVSNGVLADLEEFAGDGGVERVSGADRYATAAQLASQYQAGRDRVFLVNGEDYPDALAAAAIAGTQHEPLLLTRPGSLPDVTAQQLERLSPGEVVVVGGTSAVSEAVATKAASHADSDVRRVAGMNRYQTAAAVAEEFSPSSTPGYVASGQDYADALVASASAGRHGVPVVLTPTDRVAAGTSRALEHLAPNNIFVVGGSSAVSDTVVDELAGDAPAPPVTSAFSAGAFNRGAPTADEDFSDIVGGIDLDHGSSYYTSGNFQWGLKDRDIERVDNGMTLLMGMASKNWNGGGPNSYMAWADIAAGDHDDEIRGWGQELSTLDGPVWFAFDIEPNVKLNQGKVPKHWKPEDYAAATQRISTLVKEEASNVQFTFWVSSTQKDLTAQMYPGDDYVDIICWDAYVNRGKSPDMTPLELWSNFKDWMDEQPWGEGKTYGICETGFHNGHPDAKGAEFWAQAPEAVDELGLSFVTYFHSNSGPNGDYTMEDMPLSATAYAQAMAELQE